MVKTDVVEGKNLELWTRWRRNGGSSYTVDGAINIALFQIAEDSAVVLVGCGLPVDVSGGVQRVWHDKLNPEIAWSRAGDYFPSAEGGK